MVTELWQTRLATGLTQTANAGAALVAIATRPDILPRLRFVLYGLLIVWMVASLWRAAWSFFPEAPALPAVNVINPMNNSVAQLARPGVDIDALAASHLFGVPGESAPDVVLDAEAAAAAEAEAASALAGIEDGAPESRLPLTLRGVVAATDAGLGQAIIENNNQQELYQVGDDLPVSGDVVLAKVLPEMIVLDNGGRYELLRLFDESSLRRTAAAAPVTSPPAAVPRAVPDPRANDEENDEHADQDASAVASRYRRRLYENPESLVDVVRVSAVREGEQLRGYRVVPGRSAAAFSALGFQSGDLVTGINGLSLADPANTMRLYQTMRSATSASFELERDGQPITLSVNLEEDGS
ncbi:MAG: type II secretion system protein GspC [Pseudomonadota bacterium]